MPIINNMHNNNLNKRLLVIINIDNDNSNKKSQVISNITFLFAV